MADKTPPSRIVMIAVDNSPQAENAFNWYMTNCHHPSHEVTIIHCLHIPTAYGVTDPGVFNMMIEGMKQDGEKVQEKYTAMVKAKGIHATFMSSVEQHPECWIVDKAKEMKPSLIVMGSRGLGSVRRTLLGSVSEYVLHHAHCAVAVCHHTPGGHAEQAQKS